MKKVASQLGLLFILILSAHQLDAQVQSDSSVLITFDDPDLIKALEELLSKQNVSASFEEVYECEEDPGPCDALAECADVQYTFVCICEEGYNGFYTGKGDNETHHCEDIDECEVLNDLKAKISSKLEEWNEALNTCLEEKNNATLCGIDENEIKNFTVFLERNYRTFNVVRSDENSMYAMYADVVGAKTVEKIATFLPCDLMSDYCLNSNGTYECACSNATGFVGDRTGCSDIDECADNAGLCTHDANSKCINQIGSYTCSCLPGYVRSEVDGTCVDFGDGECSLPQKEFCSTNSKCIRNFDSFRCICNDGYQGDGRNCTDIDECALGINHGCYVNGKCVNTPGSYECVCDDGYVDNGTVCFENTDDCITSFLPTCENSTSLSCEFARLNRESARSVYQSFRYFFTLPDHVKEQICTVHGKASFKSLFDTTAADATKICDVDSGVIFKEYGFVAEEAEKKIEVYHYENKFQWFETRACKDMHDGISPIGCVQRYLSHKALTIEKIDEKFYFDVRQVFFESGCEVDVFV